MQTTRARRVSVKPYLHSATAKFVVSWGSGSKPSAIEIAAWNANNPAALPEDRVRFAQGNWKRHRRFFRSRRDANSFALAKETELENGDARALALPLELRVMADRCARKLEPFGYSLEQAVDHFVEYLKSTRRSVTVVSLISEYTAAKKQKGNKERSLKDIAHRLKVFGQTFGTRTVSTITTAEVDDWLVSLGLSAQSQNNYRAVARAFFEYAVKREYAQSNPVARVDKVRVADKPAAIFRPDELRRLLDAAAEADALPDRKVPERLPLLVIGAFAGLRQAEILRLDWSEVNLETGYIEVKAAKSKTAQRRLVPIQPNLRVWLTKYAGRTGPVWPGRKPNTHGTESNWRAALMPVRKAAGIVDWPENGLRHSFGSYHLSKYGDAARLALDMGHTTTKEIFAHYREVVLPSDAAAYWNILPRSDADNT
jgi:integrase